MKKVVWMLTVLVVALAHRGAVPRYPESPLREPVQAVLVLE